MKLEVAKVKEGETEGDKRMSSIQQRNSLLLELSKMDKEPTQDKSPSSSSYRPTPRLNMQLFSQNTARSAERFP